MYKICFEPVTETISRGYLGDISVLIAEDDYVNATKLAATAGREYSSWTRSDRVDRLFQACSDSTGIPVDELSYLVKGGKITEIRGTYLHPKLIIHLASWCSGEYAMKVSDIVMAYHVQEVEDELLRIKKKESRVREIAHKFKDQNASLSDEIKLLRETIEKERVERKKERAKREEELEEQKRMHRETVLELRGTRDVLQDTNDNLEETNENLESTNRRLNVAKNHRVLPTYNRVDENTLVLLRYPENRRGYTHGTMRVNHQNIAACLRERQRRFPGAEIILQLDYTPNAMILWKKVRNELGDRIQVKYVHITIDEEVMTEEELVREIQEISERRLTDEELEELENQY